jgi:hypothetical protein
MLGCIFGDDWLDLCSLSSHGTLTLLTEYNATRGQVLINALTGHLDFVPRLKIARRDGGVRDDVERGVEGGVSTAC